MLSPRALRHSPCHCDPVLHNQCQLFKFLPHHPTRAPSPELPRKPACTTTSQYPTKHHPVTRTRWPRILHPSTVLEGTTALPKLAPLRRARKRVPESEGGPANGYFLATMSGRLRSCRCMTRIPRSYRLVRLRRLRRGTRSRRKWVSHESNDRSFSRICTALR